MYHANIQGNIHSRQRDKLVQSFWGMSMFSTSEERQKVQNIWYEVREIKAKHEVKELRE